MSKTNVRQGLKTHEGAPAKNISFQLQLKRSVLACMLNENTFYEEGVDVKNRIRALVPQVPAEEVAAIALDARSKFKLRHIPLFLVREMARHKTHRHLVATTLASVVQRADELCEFLAIYWNGKASGEPVSAQVKQGLSRAFRKFTEYDFGKYNRKGLVTFKDVLRICHPKPETEGQSALWKKILDDQIETPDTWEVQLSGGADKKAAFERLIAEKKLGALALLRNLRKMQEVGVSDKVIGDALSTVKVERVLPFRFIAASRSAPMLEDKIEQAMFKCLSGQETISGKTILLVDVSGSMDDRISEKSDMTRMEAACGLAVLLREICPDVAIFTFSNSLVQVKPRHGFALRDEIVKSQQHTGTALGGAVALLNGLTEYDRLIVFTDEQSRDSVPDPKGKGYVINVATNKNGVGYHSWMHIDGFSEAVIDYIREYERS